MRPRLLIIINRFVIGGQAADTIPLLHQLKDEYQVKILYGEREQDEIEPLYLLNHYKGLNLEKIPTLRRTVNPFNDLITLVKLYRHMYVFKPDIVHTHGAKSGLLGRLAAWFWGKAKVVHTFHGHLFHSYFNNLTTKIIILLERSLAKITNAAIALSPSQKSELTNTFKIFPAEKVFEIPLGMVGPDEIISTKESLRSLYKIPVDQIIIAIIGRIVPIKNHLDFMKIALDILNKGVANVTFLIIGDGNDKIILEDFLREKNQAFSTPGNIKNNAKFIFTSWISDMYSVIEEIDVVVLTSSNEGTPVSLIEAQLSGKPVVAYNVGGVKDTFVNNESGYLVDKGDTKEFAIKLLELISNNILRMDMGDKGKQFSSIKFSKSAEVNAVKALYTTLLSQH